MICITHMETLLTDQMRKCPRFKDSDYCKCLWFHLAPYSLGFAGTFASCFVFLSIDAPAHRKMTNSLLSCGAVTDQSVTSILKRAHTFCRSSYLHYMLGWLPSGLHLSGANLRSAGQPYAEATPHSSFALTGTVHIFHWTQGLIRGFPAGRRVLALHQQLLYRLTRITS